MIGDHGRREESGHLEPAVTVRRTHHGNLYAHVAQSSDAICPVSFDWDAPLELEAKFGEELNGGVDVFDHDADVVHTLDRHELSLASNPPKSLRKVQDYLGHELACRTALTRQPAGDVKMVETSESAGGRSSGSRRRRRGPAGACRLELQRGALGVRPGGWLGRRRRHGHPRAGTTYP